MRLAHSVSRIQTGVESMNTKCIWLGLVIATKPGAAKKAFPWSLVWARLRRSLGEFEATIAFSIGGVSGSVGRQICNRIE